MATGDMKNNLRKLSLELRLIRAPANVARLEGMMTGNADDFLPLYDYIFQWYSTTVAAEINKAGLKLPPYDQDKSKFTECVYRVLRELFNWRPPLTVSQFLSSGFTEKKVIMSTEIIKLVKEKHTLLSSTSKSLPKTANCDGAHALVPQVKSKNISVGTDNKSVIRRRASIPSNTRLANKPVVVKGEGVPNGTGKESLKGKIDELLFHLKQVQDNVKDLKEHMVSVMSQAEGTLDKVLPVVLEILEDQYKKECEKKLLDEPPLESNNDTDLDVE